MKLNREWTRMDANRNWWMAGMGEVEQRSEGLDCNLHFTKADFFAE